MDQCEQQMALADELESLLTRYSSEFELSYPSVLGVLEVQKAMIIDAMLGEVDGFEGADFYE